MTPVSIGDLAAQFSNRLELSRLKAQTESLSTELSTGRKADIAAEERGDFSRLSALERSIAIVDRYKAASTDSALRLDTAQLALDNVQKTVSDGVSQFLAASGGQDPATLATVAEFAALNLQSVLSSLNTSVAGASLFAGTQTDTQPVGTSQSLLTVLSAQIAGAATVEDAEAAIDAWFDDPVAGFESVFYAGSMTESLQLPLSETEEILFGIKANDPVLKDTIKTFAVAALSQEPPFATDGLAQSDLLARAAENLLRNEGDLAGLRGNLGVLQARTEEAAVSLDAASFAFTIARDGIEASDPFEAATRLQAVTLQLETLYAVTARLSELSLTRYL